jgi:hypothetical protein
MIRQAISPRLAIRMRLNISDETLNTAGFQALRRCSVNVNRAASPVRARFFFNA